MIRRARNYSSWAQMNESSERLAMRIIAGLVFITLGQMKFFDSILLGTDAVSIPTGPEGFAEYLSAVGVPFPLLNAYLVCLVEMVCGFGLMVSAFLPRGHSAIVTRMMALPLMGDIFVATIAVGVRNAIGDPVRMHGIAVTAQAWRLPLEAALLLITLFFVIKPLPSSPDVYRAAAA